MEINETTARGIAQALREYAELAESGDAGDLMSQMEVDGLRAWANQLHPPALKSGDIAVAGNGVEAYIVTVDGKYLWWRHVSSGEPIVEAGNIGLVSDWSFLRREP